MVALLRSAVLAALTFKFVASAATPSPPVVEPADFNVTQALEQYGVDISKVPGLGQGQTKRANHGCELACKSLQVLIGKDAVGTKGASSYNSFVSSYWSTVQSDVHPFCVFKPSQAKDVSIFVLLARLTQCPFAVKSGGHSAFEGASNVEGGVTVSLANFKQVTLSKDKKIASVQAGNVWGAVYEQLEKDGVTVIGGRLYDIGVGGLTLGGGVSYFSNEYGWACDNVESYDVILSTGALARVSASQYPDLYWALRGGGNNFGIVVNFNLQTYPLPGGTMWIGSRVYTEDKFPAVLKAFYNYMEKAGDDPRASMYLPFAIQDNVKLAVPAMWHSELDGSKAPIYKEWNAIPSVSDDTKVQNIANWSKATAALSPSGLREVYYVMSSKSDLELIQFALKTFFDALPAVKDVAGVFPNLILQGITKPEMEQMKKNGGNALGLKADKGPFYIIHVAVMWKDSKDDATVYKFASDILRKVKAKAAERGLTNDYVYMNYASKFQDVVGGYGAENQKKLISVSNKYDPDQVFQKLQPGYFKLKGAPVPDSSYFSR